MAYYETNRQVIHLSMAKRCLDQADHLSSLPTPATFPKCQRYLIRLMLRLHR